MINEAVEMVAGFSKLAGQPISKYPQMMQNNRVSARVKWMSGEIKEFEEASNIYEQADALIDLLYYLLGTFVEFGLKPDELFCIIHDFNILKTNTVSGLIKDSDLKVIKPTNWNHPDRQIKELIDKEVGKWMKE